MPVLSACDFPHAIARGDAPIEGDFDKLVAWWSITKTVLAAAVLRLRDDGAFSIDGRYWDHPFTIRQLLRHTSGLKTYGDPAYRKAVESGAPVWTVAELLARGDAGRLLFEPGEGWAHSNIGYLYVRILSETTTGLALDGALSEPVFEPMRIAATRVAVSRHDMAGTLWGDRTNYDPRWVYHGLLIGPPSDAVRFLRALLAPGILSETARSAMLDAYPLGGAMSERPWTETGYDLGLMIGGMTDVGRAVGHSGVGPDSVSDLYMFPDRLNAAVVAAFATGTDEGIPERQAVRLALVR